MAISLMKFFLTELSKEETGSQQEEGIRMRAEISFDQYTDAMQMESDEDENYNDSQAPNSIDDEDSFDMQASGDEEILNQQFQPFRRQRDQLEDLIESETDSENEEAQCRRIQRRRLNNSDKESLKENSEEKNDPLSPQDPDTKSLLQKFTPQPSKKDKDNQNLAIQMVEARQHQRAKDYESLDAQIDEDRLKIFREQTRDDFLPLISEEFPRLVEGERDPQHGISVKNLVAAQRTQVNTLRAVFQLGKEETAKRILDSLKLIAGATTETQSLRKQNMGIRSDRFNYNKKPSSAALKSKDKKELKESGAISARNNGKNKCYIKVNRELRGYLAFGYIKNSCAYLGNPFGLKTASYIFNQYLLPAITQVRKKGI
ncbi:MAG: hypothetical protein EZS28_020760 [Streblomastix strix]|uniref:Uncharacterized protein n=1 Tax=Streblomastix strix TaxID=222440 RepID=A0A5J4VN75_9EUKA|nr:MAG: hypothetical protein EZS28_020760 [Streblomastix strix]